MPRASRGVAAHKRHKKVLAQTEGHRGVRHRLFRLAHESLLRSLAYATADRRKRKRDFRRLWIIRINAACRLQDISYHTFITGLQRAQVTVDRKILADLAVREPAAFSKLVATAKAALAES
ncbi:MAG: 50S ribosomal protein L20 [Chloroflexi bacterium]|nr:50S ribosomal protein L20 [Chloroflexota bacterium]MCL5947193.1 50S ribosomal protein L20 [Chloroflexota bacterium]